MTFVAPRRLPWLLLISAAIIFLDRLTKTLVSARIPIGEAIPVIPHFLRISISRIRSEIFLNSEQGVGPRSRTAEFHRRRE